MSNQSYYVPDQSRLPIFAAFSLFLLVMGASSTINNIGVEGSNSAFILYAGFASLFATLFFWFRKVVQEHLAGLDSAQLKKSYVYGMSWFIFSEVMFLQPFWRSFLCKGIRCALAGWTRRKRCRRRGYWSVGRF